VKSGLVNIRLFESGDVEQVARLFHETVREINQRDYSSQQVAAWAPDDIYFRDWATICSNRFTYVADDTGTIAGFAELEPDGHIDCFYCHRNYRRCGVGRQLYQAIEARARDQGIRHLTPNQYPHAGIRVFCQKNFDGSHTLKI
jgi:putative acetyltransferase